MIRRLVRYAVARGLAEGEVEASYRALNRADPLLAFAARRRLRRAVVEARRLTSLQRPEHVLRLAALFLHRRVLESSFDDEGGVLAEYATLPPAVARVRRGPWLIASAAGLLAVSVALGALAFRLSRPFDAGATDAGLVLREGVTRFVVAAGYGRDADPAILQRTRELSTGKQAHAAIGADGVGAVAGLLDATVALARTDGREIGAAHDRFRVAISKVNAAFDAAQAPFFLDGDVLESARGVTPLLLSFYVERALEIRAAKKVVRVLELWRLDGLNVKHPYLGYTRPSTPAALVLLDQVETDLIRDVLPALAPDEPMLLAEDPYQVEQPAWMVGLAASAGRAVRRHYAAIRNGGGARFERLGRLLARRRALVKKWQASVRGLGLELRLPERLIPEADYAEDLRRRVPSADLTEWKDIHAGLVEEANYETFVDLRRRYTEGVRRHEVQHRIDFDAGLTPVPDLLARRLGVENPLDAAATTLSGRARDELSAYLAAIAQAPDSPLLEFLLLMRHLFVANAASSPYAYAALGALEGVARELGADTRGTLDGRLTGPGLARLVSTVLERDAAAIRQAASAAYIEAFRRPLPTIQVESVVERTEWRH